MRGSRFIGFVEIEVGCGHKVRVKDKGVDVNNYRYSFLSECENSSPRLLL